MNVLVGTVHLIKEVLQLNGTMGSDDESIILETESTQGLMGCPVERHLLKVLREEIIDENTFF
jgi:hypothetical protein